MQCRRCPSESESLFRLHTDQLDTKVCALCANGARAVRSTSRPLFAAAIDADHEAETAIAGVYDR